jgi:hypothetical protein
MVTEPPADTLRAAPPLVTATTGPAATLTSTELDDDAPDAWSKTDTFIVYCFPVASVFGLSRNVYGCLEMDASELQSSATHSDFVGTPFELTAHWYTSPARDTTPGFPPHTDMYASAVRVNVSLVPIVIRLAPEMLTTGAAPVFTTSCVEARPQDPRKLHNVTVILYTVPVAKYPVGTVVGGLTVYFAFRYATTFAAPPSLFVVTANVTDFHGRPLLPVEPEKSILYTSHGLMLTAAAIFTEGMAAVTGGAMAVAAAGAADHVAHPVTTVHADLILPPRSLNESPGTTVATPPSTICTADADTHLHERVLFTPGKANNVRHGHEAAVCPP